MKKAIRIFLYLIYFFSALEFSCCGLFSIPYIQRRIITNWQEDFTWRNSWLRKHQDNIEITYSFDIYDSTKGWVPKPNLRDLQVFDHKTLNTNSRGLRGRAEYSYERVPDKMRIVILGDSCTFGDEVRDDETYSYFLQQELPNTEVINMGVHGYGHDQMLILLKEEVVKYKPDIVILGFLPEDMHRNQLQFRDYAKPRFVIDAAGLKLTGSPVPTPEETLQSERFRLSPYFSRIA